MLKRIPLRDLRVGMFIQEMGGRWVDHPFLRSSFKVASEKDYATLLQSNLPDLVIDTSKGLDVGSAADARPAPEPAPPPAAVTSSCAGKPHVPFEKEIDRARAIQARAKTEVTRMFNEARMGKAIEVADIAPLVDEINGSLERNAGALLSIVRLKTADDYTYMHSVAVCGLMIALGRRMGLDKDELKVVGLGGLLHDLGKIAMPTAVLNKPGKLTDEEFGVMKGHPLAGWEMLKKSNSVGEVPLDICLHHHERMDGNGYPDKLSGAALSTHARMGAVCDVYDAITSDRPYKIGWAPGESVKLMAKWCNGQFDEAIFQQFVKTVGIYPTGTLVRLKSGRLGVVIDQPESNLLQPKVKIFFSTKSQAHLTPEIVDLARSQDAITGPEDARAWGFDVGKILG
jgi:HD-GYP domain-containing protein (c-di-GMP phosphodiesterase class II)